MKYIKLIAIIFIFTILSKISLAQDTYTWTGNFDNTTFTNTGNWESSTGTAYPGIGDIAIFDKDADITMIPNNSTTSQLARIEIINAADVVFNFMGTTPFFVVDEFLVDEFSSFSIEQSDAAIFQVEIEANIYGNVFFDISSHKLMTGINGHIFFKDGGSFETGTSFSGHPFGESATQINTVTFEDGSLYFQRNGNTPFGPEGMGGYITTFEPESTFEITWGDGSLVSFSGKTYGHITNSSGIDINISSTAGSGNIFSFSSITSTDGKIEFFGADNEGIIITGDGIHAINGDIRLQTGAGGFGFTAINSYITGTYNIDLIINSPSTVSCVLIKNDNTLTLENNIDIDSDNTSSNISILGTIDCDIYTVTTSNTTLNLESGSTLITANIDGVEASIPDITFSSGANFTFNGSNAQSTGFSSFSSPVEINNLTIDVSSTVTMDNNITVFGTAHLIDGLLDIADNTLTMSGDIDLNGGTLAGDPNSSILIIDGMPADDFYIPTPLELHTLIINRQDPIVKLFGGETLRVENLFDFQIGEFHIDDGELLLNGEMSLNTGVSFNGGTIAKLTIGETATYIPNLPTLELGTFTNVSSLNIIMDGELTINDLLDLQNGILTTNEKTLNIFGNCESGGGTISSDYLSTINIENNLSNSSLTLTPGERTIGTFTINTPGDIFLPNGVDIEYSLILGNGTLSVDASDIVFSSGATFDIQGIESYFVTRGDGYVILPIAVGSSTALPVGSPLHRTNVIFENITNADTYTIRVFDEVYSNANTGTTLTYDDIVNLTWEIYPLGTPTTDITLEWENTANALNFRLDSCYISYYNNNEWDQPIPIVGTLSGMYSSAYRNNITDYGYFHVSSHYGSIPESADFSVVTAKNYDFRFTPHNFPIIDTDGDTLTQIQVLMTPALGNLYIDYDDSHTIEAGERVNANDIIDYSNIFQLKFKPIKDEIGDAAYNFYYTEFGFIVGTETDFSEPYNLCTISVTDNNNPFAEEQEFYVNENDVSGTLIGEIIATDPDTEQTLLMRVISGDTLAFKISPHGEILVGNPDLISYSINPEFVFEIIVRDNGIPNLFHNFIVRILVEEPINTTMEIANLLTPNDDGFNDFWIINGAPDVTQNFETFIFNNAGKIVFQSQSYYNNWNGSSNGKRLPPGVYYYLLRSETEEITGIITLLR